MSRVSSQSFPSTLPLRPSSDSQIPSSSDLTPRARTSSPPPRASYCVQEFLNKATNRLQLRDLPHLSTALHTRSRNAVRNSEHNNDLLEFIGDRAVNLVMAIMVEEVKISRAHHTTVRRIVCNNDTFGRLSFYMQLHHNAELEVDDERAIEEWLPQSPASPPKVLADLFESFAGAVFIQSGWDKLETWLRKLFGPIIKEVTGHYWLTTSSDQIFGHPTHPLCSRSTVPETRSQGRLLDYIEFIRAELLDRGSALLQSLPSSKMFKFDAGGRLQEPEIDDVEVAIHLLNMWICHVVIEVWPKYHKAKARAAHMLSAITGLIVNERVMAYLTSLLSLDMRCFQVERDPDVIKQSEHHTIARTSDVPAKSKAVIPTHSQRAVVFKATVGSFYHTNPSGAMDWGRKWIKPIVVRAHDILVEMQGFRPLVPRDSCATQAPHSEADSNIHEDDALVSLLSGMSTLTITSTQKTISSTKATSGALQNASINCSQRSSLKKPQSSSQHDGPPKFRIMIGTFHAGPGVGKQSNPGTSESIEDLQRGLSSLSISDRSKSLSTESEKTRTSGGGSKPQSKWLPISADMRSGDCDSIAEPKEDGCPPRCPNTSTSEAHREGQQIDDNLQKRRQSQTPPCETAKVQSVTAFAPRSVLGRGRKATAAEPPTKE